MEKSEKFLEDQTEKKAVRAKKNIEKQIKRDKLELFRWQEILDEKEEDQVKRDKLNYLGDRKYWKEKVRI